MKTMEELPQWIKELTIDGPPVPEFDHKAEYHKHLDEKYGHRKPFLLTAT
jgi:hypothetical protein